MALVIEGSGPTSNSAIFRDSITIDPIHHYSITTIADTYSDQEDRMEEALDALHDGCLPVPQWLRGISTSNRDAFNIDCGGRLQERLAHNSTNALRMPKNRLFVTTLTI